MLEARAREIAENVLFPAALDVDRADRVPPGHLDLLAADGFYGVATREDVDFAAMARIVETLASGCLTTTFVWLQHHTPVLTLLASAPNPQADTWLPALAAGERRAGIGIAGIRNPKDPLRVRAAAGGYVLTGSVPWVTGWDMIDTVYLAARDDADVVHFLLVDAVTSRSLTVVAPELVAVQASRTVNLTFTDHHVPAERLLHTQPYAQWLAADSGGSVLNGFLPLGVVDRCARLLGQMVERVPWAAAQAESLAAAAAACRAALLAPDVASQPDIAGQPDAASQPHVASQPDAASQPHVASQPDAAGQPHVASQPDIAGRPGARAAASALAWRAAGTLTIATGARAVLRDNHAQRLVREAAFLLVFGSRPAIRDTLLATMDPPP